MGTSWRNHLSDRGPFRDVDADRSELIAVDLQEPSTSSGAVRRRSTLQSAAPRAAARRGWSARSSQGFAGSFSSPWRTSDPPCLGPRRPPGSVHRLLLGRGAPAAPLPLDPPPYPRPRWRMSSLDTMMRTNSARFRVVPHPLSVHGDGLQPLSPLRCRALCSTSARAAREDRVVVRVHALSAPMTAGRGHVGGTKRVRRVAHHPCASAAIAGTPPPRAASGPCCTRSPARPRHARAPMRSSSVNH
jgi:hypothetical protein